MATQIAMKPNHKKFSSLYNTVVVTFFPIFTHGDVINAQTWEVSSPPPKKKSSRATLIQRTLLDHTKIMVFLHKPPPLGRYTGKRLVVMK